MADLSKFSIGGTAYNLKDSSARDTANAVTTAEEYDRQHNTNSYAGRSPLRFSQTRSGAPTFTWLRNRARSANFAGLRIGDYIDVPITAGANVPSQTVRYRIGAIDHYYQCGDTAKGHHIVIVPARARERHRRQGIKHQLSSVARYERQQRYRRGKAPLLGFEAARLGNQRLPASAADRASERDHGAARASRRALFFERKSSPNRAV